jgi:hypothetical protein
MIAFILAFVALLVGFTVLLCEKYGSNDDPNVSSSQVPTITPSMLPSLKPSEVSNDGLNQSPSHVPTSATSALPTLNPSASPSRNAGTISPTETAGYTYVGIPPRNPNATAFPSEADVASKCSLTSFASDGGAACDQVCNPQYLNCCDPFHTFGNSDGRTVHENRTIGNVNNLNNLTDAYYGINGTCSLSTELRGCVAYAKCQATGNVIKPAPAILPVVCSLTELARDPITCEDICREVSCCYSSEPGSNCLASNFDICLDYAPCQNLRNASVGKVETAPMDLGSVCNMRLPSCFDSCANASCCGDPFSLCYRENFMSCLTYAPCRNVTATNVTVPPKYSVLTEPPQPALQDSCQFSYSIVLAAGGPVLDRSECRRLCQEIACCSHPNPSQNCFFQDPLGCLEWEIQCQMTLL